MKRSSPGPRAWLLPLGAVAYNQAVYYGAGILALDRPHYNWELPLDRAIPFLPWTVSIYFLCFLFWALSYLYIARQEKALAYRFFLADFLGKTVCLVCFLLLPTTNVRPPVTGSGLWDALMRLLYQIDKPVNLFPSIHCYASWMCYIGLRNAPRAPSWTRPGSCLFALAVFLSTLTTKQHVVVDVLSGWLLAEGSYALAGRLMERFFPKKA